jgi:hypothetical protein
MNWSRLFLQKEQFATTAYKKVEWTATFVEVDGARLESGFAEGGKVEKLGWGHCTLETLGAFAPEANGDLQVELEDFSIHDWHTPYTEPGKDKKAAVHAGRAYANDKFLVREDGGSLHVKLDEPAILLDGKPVVTLEKARGKAAFVLLGATKGDRFLGYLPAALKSTGVMSFLFGTSALTPWFVPASEPWGGKKLIEAAKPPPELGKALADATAWKAFEESAGDLLDALLAARILFASMQFVRYG